MTWDPHDQGCQDQEAYLDHLAWTTWQTDNAQDLWPGSPDPSPPEDLERLRWAMRRLSVRLRASLAPYSTHEIAKITGETQPRVWGRRQMAHEALRHLMTYPGSPDEDATQVILLAQDECPKTRALVAVWAATGRTQTLHPSCQWTVRPRLAENGEHWWFTSGVSHAQATAPGPGRKSCRQQRSG